MWKNIVERARPHMKIWRMRIACWIPKATNALILCNTHCFSTSTMVSRTRLGIMLYVLCVSCLSPYKISCILSLLQVLLRLLNIQQMNGSPLLHFNLLKPTGYVVHHQFNIQQLYAPPTLYLCVLYLSENKQRLVPLTAQTDWFL